MLYQALLRGQPVAHATGCPQRGDPLRRASRRAGRSGAPTTSTGRCGTSSSTWSWSAWSPRPGRLAPTPTTCRPWTSGCSATSTGAGSTRCARRSRTRSGGASSRTGGPKPWPSRSASPCPRTSTSCTRPATSWPRCSGPSSPLSRKLAVRLARRRRHRRRGPLDFRATVRRSLSTGGVPVEPELPAPPPGQARDHGDRRHLGLGGLLRPVHPAPRVRDPVAVLQGAQLRLRRRHRRSDPVLRAGRRPGGGGAADQQRGRRGVGGRPLRLRPRARHLLRPLGGRGHARAPACWCSATRGTTTTPPRTGCWPSSAARPARSTGSTPSRRDYWGSGDSVIGTYGAHCDAVVECRTLRQLEKFVGDLE